MDARGRQFSQEVRAATDRGPVAGFVGASWFVEENSARVPFMTDERVLWPFLSSRFRDGLKASGVPSAIVEATVPALDPFSPRIALPPTFALFANPGLPSSLRSLAEMAGRPLSPAHADEYIQTARTEAIDVFADGTWRATDQVELTGGVRFSRESLNSTYDVSNGVPANTLGFIVHQIPGYPYLPVDETRELGANVDGWVARAAASWKASAEVRMYASVSKGRRPPTVLVDSASADVSREEEIWNFEVGCKGAIAELGIRYDVSAYQYRYRHFHSAILSAGRFTVLDAGSATGRGVELWLQGTPKPWANLFAALSCTDATFDDTNENGAPQRYAGFTLSRTPRMAVTCGGTITLSRPEAGSVFITPVWQSRSEVFFSDDNSLFNYSLRQGAYGVLNLRAGWRSHDAKWTIEVGVENCFDEDILVDAGNLGGSFGIPTAVSGSPRRWFIGVTTNR